MNILSVEKVRHLAEEVIALCHSYEMEWEDDHHFSKPTLTGELRRRSMDLTKALAQMRKFNG